VTQENLLDLGEKDIRFVNTYKYVNMTAMNMTTVDRE
jgi:hypothetical protein